MDRNDLLYNAINNYYAIQTMNSFCVEAILEADIEDAQKIPLDMYTYLMPLFENNSEQIEEICESIKLLSRMNINCFIIFCNKNIHLEEQSAFILEANECLQKYCDKKENFIFTIDAYYDIMEIYWAYERKSVLRRFDNGDN